MLSLEAMTMMMSATDGGVADESDEIPTTMINCETGLSID